MAGKPGRGGRPRIGPDALLATLEAYEEENHAGRAGVRVGVSGSEVRRRLGLLGLSPRPRGQNSSLFVDVNDPADIEAMREKLKANVEAMISGRAFDSIGACPHLSHFAQLHTTSTRFAAPGSTGTADSTPLST